MCRLRDSHMLNIYLLTVLTPAILLGGFNIPVDNIKSE